MMAGADIVSAVDRIDTSVNFSINSFRLENHTLQQLKSRSTDQLLKIIP